jgi:CheY-like chemotaxis protein
MDFPGSSDPAAALPGGAWLRGVCFADTTSAGDVPQHDLPGDRRSLPVSTPVFGNPGMTPTRAMDPSRRTRRLFAVIGEPNDWTFQALSSILEPDGFELLQARTAASLLAHTGSIRPDLVLVSDELPDLSPAEVCARLRGIASFNPATPILVTSSELVDETHRMEHLRGGAWDTLRLPANAEEFRLKIARFVDAKVLSDLTREERMLDGLTGFYSLPGLMRRAEEETAEAERHQRPLACIVFGPSLAGEENGDPEVSDERLRTTPELESQLERIFHRLGRRSDVIGRLNPNEFVVMAPSTDEEGAVRLGRRFLSEMKHLTISVGDGDDRVARVEMRAGYYAAAVPFSATAKPGQMVGRAAGALRRSQEARRFGSEIAAWHAGNVPDLEGLENDAG